MIKRRQTHSAFFFAIIKCSEIFGIARGQGLCYNAIMSIMLALAEFASFETNDLSFRPFTYADLDDFSEMVLNPRVMCFIHPGYQTRADVANLLVSAFLKEPLGKWAIVNKQTHQVIGAIRLENYHQGDRRAELGYFLSERYWRQGLMSQSLKTLSFLCFKAFDMRRLEIVVHEENKASQRLAESCGFILKERFKGSDRYTHKMRRYNRLELRREDYKYE